MRLVTDLEIHSRYARAVSKAMIVPEMTKWAAWKGIDILGTGDFTHPTWFSELKQYLAEDGSGLLKVKDASSDIRFMLTGEVSLIYSQGGKGRRVHIIIVAPSFAAASAISERIAPHGTLSSDGRPVLGLPAKQLLRYVLEVNEKLGLTDDPSDPDYAKRPGAFLIPAHVWTPWFGLFGSKSGFDSIEACFEELSAHIRSIETGLSSDLPMNWRLSANDHVALVSFSDAHSAPNLMREATVVNVTERSYATIAEALQAPTKGLSNSIDFTLEFFPEEGKYHYDGIAKEKLRLSPEERKKLEQSNPTQAKKVTVGVMSRVDELADRPVDYQPKNRPAGISMIPLQEIIADLKGVSKQAKRVQQEYERLVSQHTEFDLLIALSGSELVAAVGEELADAILAVRAGEVDIEPGYDGVYGTIKIRKKGYNKLNLTF